MCNFYGGQNAAAPSLPGVTTPAVQMVEEDKGDHCTDEHVEGGTASAPQPHGAEVCGLVALPSQLGEEEDDDSGIRHEPSLQRPDQLGATQLHYAELQDNFDNTTADSESCAVPPGAESIEANVLAPAIDTSTVQPGVETIEATVLAPANDTSTVHPGTETFEATVPTRTEGLSGLIPEEQVIDACSSGPDSVEPSSNVGSAVDSTVTEGNAMCATVTVPRNYAVMAQETDIVAMEYLSPLDASTLSFQAHDITVQSSQGKPPSSSSPTPQPKVTSIFAQVRNVLSLSSFHHLVSVYSHTLFPPSPLQNNPSCCCRSCLESRK